MGLLLFYQGYFLRHPLKNKDKVKFEISEIWVVMKGSPFMKLYSF